MATDKVRPDSSEEIIIRAGQALRVKGGIVQEPSTAPAEVNTEEAGFAAVTAPFLNSLKEGGVVPVDLDLLDEKTKYELLTGSPASDETAGKKNNNPAPTGADREPRRKPRVSHE